MSLTLALEQRRLVRAGPGEVWRALAQELGLPEDMAQGGGGNQAWGLVTLGGGRAPVRLTALEPGRRVAWAGRRWGIDVRRELVLEPVARGVNLVSREVLSGWALIPLRPWYSPRRLGREGQEWLAGVARRAEALARPKSPGRLP